MENEFEEDGNEAEAEIGKDQYSEKVKSHKKSRLSSKKIQVILLLLFVLTLFSIGFLFYLQKNTSDTDPINEISVTNTPIPTIEISKPKDAPELNVIYLGTYNGQEVIFYTTENEINTSNDPYYGYISYVDGGAAGTNNYKDVENPVKTISLKSYPDLNSRVLNDTKDKLYLNIIEGSDENKNFPYSNSNLYVLNLNTLDSKILYSFEMNSGKYENVEGSSYIMQVVNDKYAVFDVLGCYACEPVLAGKMIVNLDTGEERFRKDIGNIELDLEKNTYSYQKLEEITEECPDYLIGSPYCNDDNTMEVKRPRGGVILDTLP